jgi:hypothetical protein
MCCYSWLTPLQKSLKMTPSHDRFGTFCKVSVTFSDLNKFVYIHIERLTFTASPGKRLKGLLVSVVYAVTSRQQRNLGTCTGSSNLISGFPCETKVRANNINNQTNNRAIEANMQDLKDRNLTFTVSSQMQTSAQHCYIANAYSRNNIKLTVLIKCIKLAHQQNELCRSRLQERHQIKSGR